MNKLEDFEFQYKDIQADGRYIAGIYIEKSHDNLVVDVVNDNVMMEDKIMAKCNLPQHKATELRNWFNEAYPQWISVEDRLPETEGKYLVCMGGEKYIGVEYFIDGHFTNILVDLIVTHWQPLPKPPKGKDDEQRN